MNFSFDKLRTESCGFKKIIVVNSIFSNIRRFLGLVCVQLFAECRVGDTPEFTETPFWFIQNKEYGVSYVYVKPCTPSNNRQLGLATREC